MIFDALADVEKFYKPMHTIMVSLFVLVSVTPDFPKKTKCLTICMP
jgi:hypothetical protein